MTDRVNRKRCIWTLLFVLALILVACKQATPTAESTATVKQADAVFTAAAQTAEAMARATAAVPTATLATPTVLVPSATTPPILTEAPTLVMTPSLTLTATQEGWNMALFITDVTVPDGTSLEPGQAFVKTWRLKNVGSAIWTTAYSLIYGYGEQMGGATSTPLLQEVAVGEELDLSINLVAPVTPGRYVGYWFLQAANGKRFGVGAAYNEALWVDIYVVGGTATTSAATATSTATTSP